MLFPIYPSPIYPSPIFPSPIFPFPIATIPYLLHSSLKGPFGRTLEHDFGLFLA